MTRVETERLESLQVLLQQNPDSLTFARVADVLMRNGRLDEAIQVCEEGVRRHPYYVTGHFVLGKCYRQKKLYDMAEKEFKRVLLFDPKHIAAHRQYGDLMREIEWDNTCEMSYRKILHIDPLDSYVQSVVDEFARQSQVAAPAAPATTTRRPATPPAPAARKTATPMPAKPVEPPARKPVPSPTSGERKPPLTALPLSDEELLAASAKTSPPAARPAPEPVNLPEPSLDHSADKKGESNTVVMTKSDEARFSSILDDIFNDEVVEEADDRPAATVERRSVAAPEPPAARPLPPIESFEVQPYGRKTPAGAPPLNTTDVPRPPVSEAAPATGAEIDDMDFLPPSPAARPPRPAADLDFDFDTMPPVDKTAEHDSSSERTPVTAAPANRRRPAPTRLLEQFGESVAPMSNNEFQPRDKIVTPTLGEIYAAQGQYAKAIGVFELLSKKDPANRHYREKIDYLKKRLQETQNAG
ncbi:MAG: tetratricopeptide repeat protein [candidate division KSB1 bacterium]|nr:tetratricopeptide repeat protein [candidate division KSB1 bacterium]MDZ7273488.1 tetratricopeptide repeat protein [candidate division KSB1 bacterium]MDZ7286920.1 tetratricopeptide repeat protein [candidate division KSB1 bacterium]MDZ7299727.1 tetratricopeptide repeat protein [candidate division KSB1 bacterium]MDZ7305666.1 tetratricopeptide repeat protein [candidate division KSB1 bacterium]